MEQQAPASPGGEGPTQAPPHLPPGWIAQWDANSKKYYYVQLSTGESQWEVPTSAAPVGGGTPAPAMDHPYGAPGGGQRELITHPDGSQTVKHADGRMEPVMPDELGDPRRLEGGPTGDRGFGSMALNALTGGGKHGGSGQGGSSNNFGGLANQVFNGFTHSGSGNHGSSGGGGLGGKLASQLASNLFSSGSKPTPQSYHGRQQTTQHQNTGGIAGSLMGGVANMFGGQSNSSHNQNYGYSNAAHAGGYTGVQPPSSYQPSGLSHSATQHTPQHTPQGSLPLSSYHTPASNTHPHSTPSYPAPSSQHSNPYDQPPQHAQQHGTPGFQPGGGYEGAHQGYPGSSQHTQYSQQGQMPGPPPGQPYGQPQPPGGYGQQPNQYGGQQGVYPAYQSSSQSQSYGQGSGVAPGYGSNSGF